VKQNTRCLSTIYVSCDFGISTQNSDELIARKFIREGPIESQEQFQELKNWLAKQIHADSVIFNSLDIFVSALGIARENLCTKCWEGISPAKG